MKSSLFLILFVATITISSCCSTKVYCPVKSCKPLKTINAQNVVQKDSIAKRAGISAALLSSLGLKIDGDSLAYYNEVRKKIREFETKTPEEVFTAYNNQIETACFLRNEYYTEWKDPTNSAEDRKIFRDKYLQILDDMKSFSDFLEGRIKLSKEVGEEIKKKSQD